MLELCLLAMGTAKLAAIISGCIVGAIALWYAVVSIFLHFWGIDGLVYLLVCIKTVFGLAVGWGIIFLILTLVGAV